MARTPKSLVRRDSRRLISGFSWNWRRDGVGTTSTGRKSGNERRGRDEIPRQRDQDLLSGCQGVISEGFGPSRATTSARAVTKILGFSGLVV